MKYYGISQVGQYHINAGSNVCQDSFYIERINDDIIIASVADGVGSEEHSEYASEAAAKASVDYCVKFFEKIEDKKELIKNSFEFAYFAVQDVSILKGVPMDGLHCTLCTVIFTKDCVYHGNVGDSGAIALSSAGEYVLLTKQQNDEEGRVAPLSCNSMWVFGEKKGSFVSVLLATDGFYNYIFSPYMPNVICVDYNCNHTEPNYKILDAVMDTNKIDYDKSNQELMIEAEKYANTIPRSGLFSINDDLTFVVLLSEEEHEVNNKYVDFDENALKKEYNKKIEEELYPNRKKIEQMKKDREKEDEKINSTIENAKVEGDSNDVDSAAGLVGEIIEGIGKKLGPKLIILKK